MKKLHYFSFIISTFFFISCQDDQERQAPAPDSYPVIEVPKRTVTGYTTYPVSIEGVVSSAVRAKAPGYITNVLVDEGQKVGKGQTLFTLETESLTQDASAARANVQAAQVEVDKLEPLVKKNIISPIQLETAKAKLEQAKANLNSINANIGYATIKSPVEGYVSSINFREGSLVSPGDPTPLTHVTQTEDVYTFFSMNEREYLNFIENTPGNNLSEKIDNFPPVELQLVNGRIYEHEGRIETVTGQIDPSTGTVSFRAKFPNPGQILVSGNSGKIRIPRIYENVPVVPQTSTFEQQGRVYVYKVQGDTLAVSTIIEVLDRVQSIIVIESGIEEGETIVAQGIGKLRNNTPIQPQPVSFDSIANTLEPVFK